jgi:hypothetical protein
MTGVTQSTAVVEGLWTSAKQSSKIKSHEIENERWKEVQRKEERHLTR